MQVLMVEKVAAVAMAHAQERASTATSRGDKTPVELFRAGVGAMSHDIAVVAQGLMSCSSVA